MEGFAREKFLKLSFTHHYRVHVPAKPAVIDQSDVFDYSTHMEAGGEQETLPNWIVRLASGQ